VTTSVLFIFLHLQLDQNFFIDLSLLPWLMWFIKNTLDHFYAYRKSNVKTQEKYQNIMQELAVRERNTRMALNDESYSSVSPFQQASQNHQIEITL
jgi:hypothetical protein